ncbi:MAG: sulfite exporter TauE/SafE family protein [bacterium]
MTKTLIPIAGMHCKSCEILVQEKLESVDGVERAEVSVKHSQAIVHLKKDIKKEILEQAIKDAGYQVSGKKLPWINTDWHDWLNLIIAAMILGVGINLFVTLGWQANFADINNPQNLFVVLLIGLTAGFSTCMALSGGLIMGLSARHNQKHPEATGWQKFRPHIYFNLGRLLSYFILGGAIGLAGSALSISVSFWAFLTLLVGLVMLTLGIQLTNVFPRLNSISLPSGLAKFLKIKNKSDKEYNNTNALIIGALTFFLPCGFTQAMQLYAMSTGNFFSGAMIMFVFALGTMVGLLSIGIFTSIIKGKVARLFFKFIGLLVILLAIINIINGWNLLGLQGRLNFSANNTVQDPNQPVQIIKADFTLNGDISPTTFTVKAGAPVRFEVNPLENGSGCMSTIMIPGLYSKPIYLKKGQLIIMEFTPKSPGTYPITCAMGVKRGELIVQ